MYKTEAFLWLVNFLFVQYLFKCGKISKISVPLFIQFSYPQLSLTKSILAQSCSVDVVIFCKTKTFSCITMKQHKLKTFHRTTNNYRLLIITSFLRRI